MSIDWIAKAKTFAPRVRDFVNGGFSEPVGEELVKHSPRDGRLLYQFGSGESGVVDVAVGAAREAFADGRWSQLAVQIRRDILLKWATLIESHAQELALLECLDVGKPITDARSFDVPTAVALIRYYAEAADKFHGQVYGADRSSLSYQLYRPDGVVGGIVGWNFPLLLAAGKIAPVLATGNTLVLKPSELTSLSAGRIAELATEAGVPPGVLNVVHGGPAVGDALGRHADVDLVTFTGSTHTGKKLMVAAGQSNMKRLILECGGKTPSIVFDDCPSLDAVAGALLAGSFWNQGQVCTASSRLLVQRGIKNELLALLVKKVEALKLGDPLEAETTFGPLVSRGHLTKVQGYIDGGEKEGARVLYRSSARAPDDSGFYVAPIIFDAVAAGQRLAQEEIFGPVLSVMPFDDEVEAVVLANNTIYGLSATIWTKDLGRAHRVTMGLKAGSIVVNATAEPSGGPAIGTVSGGGHKQSGIGVEGGLDGLKAYSAQTAVQYFV